MDPAQIQRRYMKGVDGRSPVNPIVRKIGNARLYDYSLSFAGDSVTWGGATANITFDPGSFIPGVIYSTDHDQERTLAWFENADGHADPALYNTHEKIEVAVEGDDGLMYPVYTFVNTSKKPTKPPSRKYLEKIKSAYSAMMNEATTDKEGKLLRECIVVGGYASGGNVLGKTRDRNYRPHIEIIRDLTFDLTEVVYLHDIHTNYMEGMNSHGIGIVNSALLVVADEKAGSDKKKKKGISNDGPRIIRALTFKTLSETIKSLITFDTGLKGHTLVGDANTLYSIEMTSKHNPIIKRLNPGSGFSVRTNHGLAHPNAGYSPKGDQLPDYLSSKIRKASAEMELVKAKDYEDIMPKIAQQHFEKDSNYNMLRKTDNMKSTSQMLMHLDKLEFLCYIFSGQCKFGGVIDKTPDTYKPKIKISIMSYE